MGSGIPAFIYFLPVATFFFFPLPFSSFIYYYFFTALFLLSLFYTLSLFIYLTFIFVLVLFASLIIPFVSVNIMVFWNVTPCSLVDKAQWLVGIFCCYFMAEVCSLLISTSVVLIYQPHLTMPSSSSFTFRIWNLVCIPLFLFIFLVNFHLLSP